MFICEMEKDDFEVFLESIKEKVRDLLPRYLGVIFFLVLLFSFVVLCYANYYRVQTNTESARYMLSALVQSQAAIIAIVISLTLITVQLTASAYSIRVINIFKRSFGWQALFVFYGISIFYGLLVLKMIKGANDFSHELSSITYLNIPLETHITNVYSLGGLTFLMLILYLQSIFNLLNPVNIINRLKIDITKDALLNSEEDPIQPIMDIVHGSIMKYDIETTRVGLKAVTDRVIEIIDSNCEDEISEDFCHHLRRVASSAARIGDEEAIVAVIKNLTSFMKSEAEKKLEYASMQAIYSIGTIGMNAVNKGLEYATGEAAWCLGEVGKTALNEDLKGADDAAWYLGEIGKIATKKELTDEAMNAEVVYSLVTIGIIAEKKEPSPFTPIWQASLSLAELARLNEEIAKKAIRECESKLKKQDRESFQKFIKIYEQKLEELRAEKKNSE